MADPSEWRTRTVNIVPTTLPQICYRNTSRNVTVQYCTILQQIYSAKMMQNRSFTVIYLYIYVNFSFVCVCRLSRTISYLQTCWEYPPSAKTHALNCARSTLGLLIDIFVNDRHAVKCWHTARAPVAKYRCDDKWRQQRSEIISKLTVNHSIKQKHLPVYRSKTKLTSAVYIIVANVISSCTVKDSNFARYSAETDLRRGDEGLHCILISDVKFHEIF